MSCWKYLPNDILDIIFHYIGPQTKISHFPETYIVSPTKDILQCQLTCRNWESLARSAYYKCITLKSLQQLERLVYLLRCSNTGPLVKYIIFEYRSDEVGTDIIISSIFQIAHSFTELKRMCFNFDFDPIIFETIGRERLNNHFLKLEAIPRNFYRKRNGVSQYNAAAYLLQQSLRELAIYDKNLESFENKEYLKSFLNINTLIFNLFECCNIYTVDQHISKCPTVKWVHIANSAYLYDTNTIKLWNTKISSHNICPQVERIQVRNFLFDTRIYGYLMNVFPNVKRFSLEFKPIPDLSGQLPTDTALQYLHYLIKIPDVYVNYIPIQNLNDTMMGFYDISNTVKKLDIGYRRTNKKNEPSFLGVCITSKADVNTNVDFTYNQDKLLVLPRTGLIERSGNNLQYLRINMGLKFDDMKVIANSSDYPDILSYIMYKCTNLQSLYIWRAFLYFENCPQLKMKPISREFVGIYKSLIHPSFLTGLSYHAPYIEKFTISYCQFTDKTYNNLNFFLDMPNTEFGSIIYGDHVRIDQFYLMLVTTLDSNTVCYCGNRDNYERCEELDYRMSRSSKRSLSIFIICKSIRIIDIHSSNFSITIKT